VRRGRGLMPSGAGQLSSGAAVRAAGQVPSPSGRRPDRSLPCPPRPVPPWGMSVQPVERTSSVHASGVQVSGASRCPDRQACGVRGAAAALSAPRRTGVRAAPGWAQRVDVPSWSAGGVVACLASGLTRSGGGGVGRGWLAPGSTGAQGRRLAGVPAPAPPGRRADTGAGPGPGCRPGGGGAWDRADAPRPPQGVLGRSPV
jgi:hypothetical protein